MIKLEHLYKTYHLKDLDVEACKDVNITINDGEIYGIIGYSGAGKSSLVRCINLLEKPDAGKITVSDNVLFETINEEVLKDGKTKYKNRIIKSKELKKARRKIGMIFQHFNLLDRLTVFDNVAYPLKFQGHTKSYIKEKVESLLDLVGLSDKKDVYPSQLSGGQKQRVAIARALANDPDVLLSDEATSALDPNVTEQILNLLKELNKKLNITIVLITHEMAVIKSICDRVAVMENGKVVEEGSVYDIFEHPQQAISKKFIASTSSLSKVDKLINDKNELIIPKKNGVLVKLQFNDKSVSESLISQTAKQFDVKINIVLANIEIIQNKPLGQTIVVVDGTKKQIKDSLEFIKSHGVYVENLYDGGELND